MSKITYSNEVRMINPALAINDWSGVALESAMATNFKEDELSICIKNEIAFEDGFISKAKAFIQKLIAQIGSFISKKIESVNSYLASKRFKSIDQRMSSFKLYMSQKFAQGKYNTDRNVWTLLENDEEYRRGFEKALESLNHYLEEPWGSPQDFYADTKYHFAVPSALAFMISKRSKAKVVPNVKSTVKIIDLIKTLVEQSSRYRWDEFMIEGSVDTGVIDELRSLVGSYDLKDGLIDKCDDLSTRIRSLFTDAGASLIDSGISIYNTETNYEYAKALTGKTAGAVNALRSCSKYIQKVNKDFKDEFGRDDDDSTRNTLNRMQSYISMIGALSGYLGSVSRTIDQIDGYNSAMMTVLKYINPDYVNQHIKDRGLLGGGKSELDTQAYSLLMNDAGVIEMALEHFELHSVKDEMRTISDNYVNAVAIESRIHAYGVCIKDAVALEGMKPDCFKGQQLTDLFDLRPSNRNAEVALEVSSVLKTALLSALVTIVIKYMNNIVEFIQTKLSKERLNRAIKTMAKFRISITKKVPSADKYKEQNSNIMDGLQKMRGVDKTGNSNPSGTSHNSAVKARPMQTPVDDRPNLKRDLYKNTLIPLFGVDDNAAAGLASCVDAQDFLRFLNSTNVKGPMMFANRPIEKARKLVVFANTTVAQLHNISNGMNSIKQQLDSFIAGTRNSPYFVTEANGPMKTFLGDESTNDVSTLSKNVKIELAIWRRKNSLVGSELYRDPKVIQDTFAMLEGFKNEDAVRALNKFSNDIKGVSTAAQASLDKFLKVESDPERKAEVEAAVKKYVNELRDLAEGIGAIVQTVSLAVSYIESLANAVNIFIEG